MGSLVVRSARGFTAGTCTTISTTTCSGAGNQAAKRATFFTGSTRIKGAASHDVGGPNSMLGSNIIVVRIITPGLSSASTAEVSGFEYTLVNTIAHRTIGIEHCIDSSISSDIDVDGVIPCKSYANTVSNVYRIKGEFGYFVLNSIG